MSSEKSPSVLGNAPQQPQPDSYPHPPPQGPPPSLQQHPNEIPMPDSNVPPFNTIHHTSSMSESSLYGAATPTSSHPASPFPPQQYAAAPQPGSAKSGWSQRLAQLGGKAAGPLNSLASKMGAESFMPATMDRELEKAVRTLKGFCKDGVYAPSGPEPAKPETLLTIPPRAIAQAVGLAIFTTGRVGFHVSSSTGSGILLSRLPDGRWSPPSGIQVHSVGVGFTFGVDIYDCVMVINTREALQAFTRTRTSLGSDLAVAAGVWGAGGSVDFAAPGPDKKGKERAGAAQAPIPAAAQQQQQQQPQASAAQSFGPPPTTAAKGAASLRQAISQAKPVYSYVRSRGLYLGVQLDGTVVTQRADANAALYGARIPVEAILRGEVPAGVWQHQAAPLFDLLRSIEQWASPEPGVNLNATAEAMRRMDMGSQQQPQQQQQPVAAGPSANWKEREAAAERAAAAGHGLSDAAPPGYSEPEHVEDLPPAYVDEGHVRAGVGDSKSAPPPPPQ